MRKNKALWAVAVLVLFLLGLTAWRFYGVFTAEPTRKGGGRRGRGGGGGAITVTVQPVTKRVLQFTFEQVGNVESSQTVDIVARSAGPILDLPLREGDPVRRGQILGHIDPATANANLLKKRSDLATARFNYFQLLSQQGLTNVQATSSVAIAAADLNAAQANVNKSRQVFKATITQGQSTVAQAQARLVGAQAQQRQATVDFTKAKTQYERMLELQRQGFASNADLQNSYQDVLAKYAAVDVQKANAQAAEREVTNARAQSQKENTSAVADIQTTRATRASKQAALDTAQAGTAKTEAFQQQLKAQESLVEAAQAELKTAELDLQNTILRSPVDGFVSDRKLDVGAVTGVGTVIMTVQAGGQVWVVTPLPQEAYSRVTRGHPCEVRIDGIRERVFDARVAYKDPALDAASRQFNVRVKITDPEGLVKPGMFARVRIKVGRRDPRVVVPNSALYEKNDTERTATVYKVVDKKVQVVKIRRGLADESDTVVTDGLKEGDQVVVQAAGALRDDQTVTPVAPDATAPETPNASMTPSGDATPRRRRRSER